MAPAAIPYTIFQTQQCGWGASVSLGDGDKGWPDNGPVHVMAGHTGVFLRKFRTRSGVQREGRQKAQ